MFATVGFPSLEWKEILPLETGEPWLVIFPTTEPVFSSDPVAGAASTRMRSAAVTARHQGMGSENMTSSFETLEGFPLRGNENRSLELALARVLAHELSLGQDVAFHPCQELVLGGAGRQIELGIQ